MTVRNRILSLLALLSIGLYPIEEVSTQIPGSERTKPHLPSWNFMSLSTTGVDSFLKEHPTWDGRGVTILIFDTGVDPSIAGLGRTSTGEPKVVDLVDLSGSNVVSLIAAERDDDEVEAEENDDIRLDLGDHAASIPEDELFIGMIEERRFRNASIRDFDGDGLSETSFRILLFPTANGPRVAVDADGNGRLDTDDPILGDYRATAETLLFRQKEADDASPVTAGLSIDAAEQRVTLHYDMDGHGTHVAGIAAGYGISNESGFNGVAPGAEVISVKFSSDPDESLTITGTMEAAYNYAAELADSLALVGRPVVVNMSFGIGSSYEGKAKMEEMIDDIIAKHSNLYVVTSAGNEGPGLSSVGIPAAAALPISVGAALPRGIARDAYGAAIEQDILWNFSSRGGEVDKPDVVAPGTAISTVPRFSFDMRASGTSMASPYTAGVIALLLSAAAEEYPGWIPAQSLIRRALRTSARRLPQYAAIEQGGGMVDVTAAWALIKRWKASGYAADFQEYTVTTDSPGYIDGSGSAAYWRTGWMPTSEYRQEFRVARRTIAAYPIDDDEFFRAYRLSSTVDWMTPIQQTVFIRGDRYAKVEVLYDPEKMEEPGLYSGRIIGRRERGDRATPEDEIEFELAATFTLPHRLTATNNYRVATTPRAIGPGELDRHYVALPPGASGLRMALSVDEGAQATVSAVIVDRHGVIATYLPEVDGRDRTESTALIDAKELGDGIVEIVIKGEPFTGSGGTADYTLAIEGVMIDFDIATLRRPSGVDDLVVTATNVGTDPVEGRLGYTVKGYERIITDTLRDPSRPYHRSVTLTPHDGALWVSVVFAPEDYMRSTDILLRLLDSTGLSQGSQAYHGPSEWVFLPNFYRDGIARDFTLELVFGAASQADVATDPIPFRIIERHVRPTEFEKLGSGRNDRIFYPFLPRSMSTLLPALEGGIPAGYYPIGELRFRPDSRDDDEEILIEFPVH